MAEYIERRALMEDARHDKAIMANLAGIADIANLINDQPAADVAPVVHGEWIKNKDDCWWEGSETRFCSCCGQGINVECIPWFKFCPDCGAKMGGKGETDG